jgi:polar amino acid transport system ATP-binding protein
VWGGVALVLSYSAYVAEVFRAGIESVHPSQRMAARSLGPGRPQTLRHVVLPQAVRRVYAPLLNDLVSLMKDSGLVSLLGVTIDAVRAASIDSARSFNYTPYVVAGRAVPAAHHPADPAHRRDLLPGVAPARAAERRLMTPVLRMREVSKVFGSSWVLQGVDLELADGTATALIGASGSGKSTLLRCANLLEQVDDGVIELDGRDITDPRVDPDEVRRHIGVVFQAYNLFPHRSVLDNITLAPRKVHRTPRAEAEERALELLSRFGLGDKAADYPDRLSGGQQQRVAIVRAIATRPRLLLLDEVTSALDPELVGEVLELVEELKDEGMTMLLATHEMAFARGVADEVCFLDRGRVLERGPAAQVLGDPQQERTQQFLRRVLT